jgi:hypothetical protein
VSAKEKPVNSRPVVSFFVFLALIIPQVGAVDSAMAGALPTAKTGLAAATAEASKWQADAVLVVVETSTAEPDGTAYSWMYLYDSPASKQQAAVLVDEKGEVSLMPGAATAFHEPLGEFVDSPVAMAAAVAAGMKTHDFGMKMSLTMSKRAEWFMSDRDHGYMVDAATGKFLRKEE